MISEDELQCPKYGSPTVITNVAPNGAQIHTTTAQHPLSPGDTMYTNNWSCFPTRQRSHISTMRARSVIMLGKYAIKTRVGNFAENFDGGDLLPPPVQHTSSECSQNDGTRNKNTTTTNNRHRPGSISRSSSSAASFATTLEQIHRAKMGELPAFVAADRRYALSSSPLLHRPMSAAAVVPRAVVARLSGQQTVSSRARSAQIGGSGSEVGGRAGGRGVVGGYSWVTLNLFADSQRAMYDSHGELRGSKRTK